MKPNLVRGSSFDEGFAKEPTSLNMVDNLLDDLVGFRLAFDSATRVYRGGSWYFTAGGARAAYRNWLYAGNRVDSLGFRLVRATERA